MCLNRILAKAIQAPEMFPRFSQSAMDGFAVRRADLAGASEKSPVKLPVVSEAFAGQANIRPLSPGQTAQIATGGPIPEGADAVVPKELVRHAEGVVMFFRQPEPNDNIRAAGEDLKAGQLLLPAGKRLDAASIGLLSMFGIGEVEVVTLPRVGVVATGNELAEGEMLAHPHQIRDSNTPALCALLRQMGIEPTVVCRVKDESRDLADTLARTLEKVDVLVTSGGVSVGERDWVRAVSAQLGIEEIFWRVAQKPGKPLFLGRRHTKLLFGLPGNPLSVMVCFYEYVWPALRKAAGFPESEWFLRAEWARLVEDEKKPADRTVFVPALTATSEGWPLARLSPKRGSHLLSALAHANSLAVLPEGVTELCAGASVEVHHLP
jgi:molybdopterin molybdotransferase